MSGVQLRFDSENRAQIQIVPCNTKEIDKWIAERHYLKSAPAIAMLRLWVLSEGKRIGGMLWNHPTASNLDQVKLLELTRMYFIDETEPFVESRSLALARSYIRKHMPKVKGLIAYSSTGQGHEGTVYEADGWFSVGQGGGAPWGHREGRTDRDLSKKIRWVRSP